jgi:tetratricopeptide (TPR) repeat protein
VRRSECVPNSLGSSPTLPIHSETRRAYCEAIADDPNDPCVLRWAGHTLAFWGDYDRGLTVLEKAARLDVNGSQVLNSLGWVMVYACVEPDRAILHYERAMRLSPRDPEIGIMLNGIAMAHLIAERTVQALSAAQKAIDDWPRFGSSHRCKIAALVGLGRLQDAKVAAATFLALHDHDENAEVSRCRLPAKILGRIECRRSAGMRTSLRHCCGA